MNSYLAECIGTALLILLGNGVVATVVLNKSKGQNGGWIVIALGWGLAVAFAVYAVGRVSGAHINPAGTVALASIGAFPFSQVLGYIVAQMIGAMIGAVLVFDVLAIGKIAFGATGNEAAWTTAVSTYFGPLLVGMLGFQCWHPSSAESPVPSSSIF